MLLCLDPNSRIPQPRFMTGSVRRTALGSATAIGISFAVFLWSPGAMAAAGCDTTTPSIGQTIVCDAAGTETIAVPTGANAVEVVVIGGGGGSGGEVSGVSGGDGGAGATVTATLNLPAGSALQVDVGAGGTASFGGRGGGYSRITANSTLLALAGGGGGGSQGGGNDRGSGGDGAVSGTSGAGGNGQGSPEDNRGGRGGSAGNGGSGGLDSSSNPVDSGGDYNLASNSGGLGTAHSDTAGGGGDGFGGGGSGFTGGGLYFGGGGAGGSYTNPSQIIGSATYAPASGAPGSAGLGGSGTTANFGADGSDGSVQIRFIIIPTPSTGSSVAAPRAISLDFTLPTGIECRFDSVEASLGSWIELPSASDCTITTRTTDSQPTLLGWATNADFPINIAQRQVDNGWGAYETFNSDGQITGVFIPAGGYTLVSNDTNLHPIWSE